MDRRRRNLKHESNRAYQRALDMPTVGPNSYGILFEQAQNVCLLKLPNNPAVKYEGIDRVRTAFINAASKVYFSTIPGNIAFAFYDSFYLDTPKPLNPEQSSIVSMYYARLRIAGKRHQIGTSFQEAFSAGVTSVGSIETMTFTGSRIILDIPDITPIVQPLYERNQQSMPGNTVFLGYVYDRAIIESVKGVGVHLYSKDEVVDRVTKERYGDQPQKQGRRHKKPSLDLNQ